MVEVRGGGGANALGGGGGGGGAGAVGGDLVQMAPASTLRW
jgi:hypothetical protein